MCYVSITKFRDNLKKYIEISQNEDVYITSNNETVAVLSNPKEKAYQEFMKLEGCLKDGDDGKDYDEMIGEEIMKKCGF